MLGRGYTFLRGMISLVQGAELLNCMGCRINLIPLEAEMIYSISCRGSTLAFYIPSVKLLAACRQAQKGKCHLPTINFRKRAVSFGEAKRQKTGSLMGKGYMHLKKCRLKLCLDPLVLTVKTSVKDGTTQSESSESSAFGGDAS